MAMRSNWAWLRAMVPALGMAGLGFGLGVPAVTTGCVSRPSDWSESTHGDSTPSYETVFPSDRVLELELEFAPEALATVRSDLTALLGSMSMPMPMGPGGDASMPLPPGDGGMPPFGMDGGMGGGPGAGGSLLTRDPVYVESTVHFGGHTWTHVGFRLKGNSSLASLGREGNRKLPFRLDLDQYEDSHPEVYNQRFYGFKKLTFSPNFGDNSQVREAFVDESLAAMGLPAPRTSFVRVQVRYGSTVEYWGLYTLVEDPADRAFLDRSFASHSGNLYKPEGEGAAWTRFVQTSFEKKNNETAADYSDVEQAIAALHSTRSDPAAWRAGLERYLDVPGFLRWLATNTVVKNWDAYGQMAHNYYLYNDPASANRLRWIPWDHNLAMDADFGGGGMQANPNATAYDELLHTATGEAWPLIRYLLDDPEYRAQYRRELEAVLAGPLAPATAETRLRALHARVDSAVRDEVDGSRTAASYEAFAQSLEGSAGLVTWVNQRAARVQEALAQP